MEERQELDERRIRELFRQTGDSIQAILDYFRLKNKVLWEGAAWTSGTKTIPGISKYQRIKVYPWANLEGVELERVGGANFKGQGFIQGVSSSKAYRTEMACALSLNGDMAAIVQADFVQHIGGGTHGALSNMGFLKITGTEPLLPDSLKKIAGGGVVHRLLSLLDCRGCAA